MLPKPISHPMTNLLCKRSYIHLHSTSKLAATHYWFTQSACCSSIISKDQTWAYRPIGIAGTEAD